MEGFRSVDRVFRPLPNTQKPIPNIHIRRVRHGAFGSSASLVAPAARNTCLTDPDGLRESVFITIASKS